MQDQVESLWRFNLPAGQISSSQTQAENTMTLNAWESGELKFLLVSPERQESVPFMQAMARVKPQMVVVDESHCISSWADSFRPAYVKIGRFVEQMKPQVVLAMTATATPDIEADIRRVLGVPNAAKVVYYPKRANLKLETAHWPTFDPDLDLLKRIDPERYKARKKELGFKEILQAVNEIDGSTIVYSLTQKMCDLLQAVIGPKVEGGAIAYHGGMTPDERTTNQTAFMNNSSRVVFATNAFGMGINKSNIRGIVHRHIPGSIEALTQEQGRAGRDGLDSRCVVFNDEDSYRTSKFFIENTFPPTVKIEEVCHYLTQVQDSAGFVTKTAKEIAEGMRWTFFGADGTVQACLGVLRANGVVEREDEKNKVIRVRVFRDHADDRYQNLMNIIRQMGTLKGQYYEVEQAQLIQLSQKKWSTVRQSLNDLSDNSYIDYQAPFKGKATRVVGKIEQVDFSRNDRKRAEAFRKLELVKSYMLIPDDEKHDFLIKYFGAV